MINFDYKKLYYENCCPPDQNADFLTISENTHAFTTQSQNVNSLMLAADTHIKKV